MIRYILYISLFLYCSSVVAKDSTAEGSSNTNQKVLHTGFDEPKPNEYINIDPQGSITRSQCPYTCADRDIPKEHCKTWTSKSNPDDCYVQDTRIKSNAIP